MIDANQINPLWRFEIGVIGCGSLNTTNALKHMIDRSKERILLID